MGGKNLVGASEKSFLGKTKEWENALQEKGCKS